MREEFPIRKIKQNTRGHPSHAQVRSSRLLTMWKLASLFSVNTRSLLFEKSLFWRPWFSATTDWNLELLTAIICASLNCTEASHILSLGTVISSSLRKPRNPRQQAAQRIFLSNVLYMMMKWKWKWATKKNPMHEVHNQVILAPPRLENGDNSCFVIPHSNCVTLPLPPPKITCHHNGQELLHCSMHWCPQLGPFEHWSLHTVVITHSSTAPGAGRVRH